MLQNRIKRALTQSVMVMAAVASLAASSLAVAPDLRNKSMDLRFTSVPSTIGANVWVNWNAVYNTSASGVVTTQGTMRYLPAGSPFTVNITMTPQNGATGYAITIVPASSILGTSYSGSIKAESGGGLFLAGSGIRTDLRYQYGFGFYFASSGPNPFWGSGYSIPW